MADHADAVARVDAERLAHTPELSTVDAQHADLQRLVHLLASLFYPRTSGRRP